MREIPDPTWNSVGKDRDSQYILINIHSETTNKCRGGNKPGEVLVHSEPLPRTEMGKRRFYSTINSILLATDSFNIPAFLVSLDTPSPVGERFKNKG